jgi:hypothetical protein
LDVFGTSMTLFHYYTYFKSFREFDKIQLAVASVFLGCKLHSIFLNIEEAHKDYNELKASSLGMNGSLNQMPFDVVKFEIELLNILGFELEIPTPYGYIIEYARKLKLIDTEKERIINIAFNIAHDSYRRPVSVYYTPKQIALACLYIAINLTHEEGMQVSELPNAEIYNIHEINKCTDVLLSLFEDRLRISK